MTNMAEDESDEYPTTFEDCTCDHESTDHGWMGCEVPECQCEGSWTGG